MPTLPLFRCVRAVALTAAVLAAPAVAVPPPAGPPPGTDFSITSSLGGQWSLSGLPASPWTPVTGGLAGQWHAEGLVSANGWMALDWDIDVHEDPLVTQSYTLTNVTAVPQTFTMTTVLPATVGATTLTFGSIVGTLTNAGGAGVATLTNAGAAPLYAALIDGLTYRTLVPAPFTYSTSPLPGTMAAIPLTSFGLPVPLTGQPGVASSIAVTNVFTLSPGDTVQLTSSFFIESEIPAPGAAGLLGAAGLAWGRRRRAAR